jgi:hypothetical protein
MDKVAQSKDNPHALDRQNGSYLILQVCLTSLQQADSGSTGNLDVG